MPEGTATGTTTDDGRYIETTPYGSTINWQGRPRTETGGVLIGDTPESLLPLVIDRLRVLNHHPSTSARETSLAITHLEEALHWLTARRLAREVQGVLGTYAPHNDGSTAGDRTPA